MRRLFTLLIHLTHTSDIMKSFFKRLLFLCMFPVYILYIVLATVLYTPFWLLTGKDLHESVNFQKFSNWHDSLIKKKEPNSNSNRRIQKVTMPV